MRIDELKRLGYRIVSNQNGTLRTFLSGDIVSGEIGSVVQPGGEGLYLGTIKDFVFNYYSGMSAYPDVLLTYRYNIKDLLKGDPESGISKPPHDGGEIIVRKATLVDIEYLPEED